MKKHIFLRLIMPLLLLCSSLTHAGKRQKWVLDAQLTDAFYSNRHSDIKKQQITGKQITDICWAATNGESARVQYFINQDPTLINSQDKEGKTPLHWAAGKGQTQVVRLLLTSNANLKITDNKGLTPLHWAAGKGQTQAIQLLLASNADPKSIDNDGLTPLHWATIGGWHEVVGLLLQHGADPDAQDSVKQRTALHWIIRMSRAGLEKRGEQLPIATVDKIIRLLIKHGAKTNLLDSEHQTAEFWLNGYASKHGTLTAAESKLLKNALKLDKSLTPAQLEQLKAQVIQNDLSWLEDTNQHNHLKARSDQLVDIFQENN